MEWWAPPLWGGTEWALRINNKYLKKTARDFPMGFLVHESFPVHSIQVFQIFLGLGDNGKLTRPQSCVIKKSNYKGKTRHHCALNSLRSQQFPERFWLRNSISMSHEGKCSLLVMWLLLTPVRITTLVRNRWTFYFLLFHAAKIWESPLQKCSHLQLLENTGKKILRKSIIQCFGGFCQIYFVL